MATDGMTVRLHLKRMKVVRVVTDEIDELVIEVADTRSVGALPGVRAQDQKGPRDAPGGGARHPPRAAHHLVWLQRRFECDNCGERHTEDHPEI